MTAGNQPAHDDDATQAPTVAPPPVSSRVKRWAPRVLALLSAVAISVAIFALRDRIEQIGAYGYPGVFLVSVLGSATIVLPAPSLAVVFALGSSLNPLFVGLAAGLGEALGELTGYLAGYSGGAIIENRERYAQLERLERRYGIWVVFVLSVIPNPIFDLAGIAAGMLKFPLYRFFLACWAGKTIKTILVALAGAGVWGAFSQWLR